MICQAWFSLCSIWDCTYLHVWRCVLCDVLVARRMLGIPLVASLCCIFSFSTEHTQYLQTQKLVLFGAHVFHIGRPDSWPDFCLAGTPEASILAECGSCVLQYGCALWWWVLANPFLSLTFFPSLAWYFQIFLSQYINLFLNMNYIYLFWGRVCAWHVHLGVRGQFEGVSSILPPCTF